jgi:hypothetical protein
LGWYFTFMLIGPHGVDNAGHSGTAFLCVAQDRQAVKYPPLFGRSGDGMVQGAFVKVDRMIYFTLCDIVFGIADAGGNAYPAARAIIIIGIAVGINLSSGSNGPDQINDDRPLSTLPYALGRISREFTVHCPQAPENAAGTIAGAAKNGVQYEPNIIVAGHPFSAVIDGDQLPAFLHDPPITGL